MTRYFPIHEDAMAADERGTFVRVADVEAWQAKLLDLFSEVSDGSDAQIRINYHNSIGDALIALRDAIRDT